ncbi:MAG: glycosyltransferase involved in cell wall biosynthesis [Rhodothermales bacterium]
MTLAAQAGYCPVRILQLTTEFRPAGAERIVANLCASLRDAGHEVQAVALQSLPDDPTILEALADADVEIHSLEMSKRQPWRATRLRALVREFQPDVVHSHLIHANLASRLFGTGSHRLVNTVHIAERREDKGWHFKLDRATLSRCHCQTAVSEAVREFHAAQLGIDPKRMPVVYNGIESPRQLSLDEICELRNSWGFAGCTKVVGSVGRLAAQKGYDRLLRWCGELSHRVPDGECWGVVLLGEGPEREALAEIAAGLSANLKVVMPGFRADAADCAGAFDVFVMPSRYEGFGLTLAEAMGHGIPIVAAEIDSLPELLGFYNNGHVADFDRVSCVDAILASLARGRVAGVTPFSIEAMRDGYLEVYERAHLRR